MRELAAEAVPCSLHAAANAILVGLSRRCRAGTVLALGAGLHLVNEVAGTSTADVVDGSLLGAEALLLLELLVEAEHGALLLAVDVAGAATAGGEEGVGGRRSELDAGCWARGGLAVGDVGGLDAGDVAGAATARVDVGAAYGWVRLGDVEGRHLVVCFGVG